MNEFKDKVVLITGGARGLGRNLVKAFAQLKAHVVFSDILKNEGLDAEKQFQKEGLKVSCLEIDLSQKGQAQMMIQKVCDRFGKIDVLVNNARSGSRRAFLEEDETSWRETLSVTLDAAFFASQEGIRLMSKRGEGSIVNIGSVAAEYVCQESPSYHVAKAGLLQMTRYLAANAGKFGVRVNAVIPGFIVQDQHQERFQHQDNTKYRDLANSCHPIGHTGASSDVVSSVLFLSSENARFITGQTITVDGGLTIQDPFDLGYRLTRS